MQLIITISIILTAGFLVIAGILLLFSPEVLISINDYLIGLSNKKITVSKDKLLSIDVYIFTKRILFGFALILLGIYLIYTISLLF
jgi:hypothetical protein